jgi:hypothetical protein
MNNNVFNNTSGYELISDDEYNELLIEKDNFIKIGDKSFLTNNSNKNNQTGFATGLVLGMSAGIAFILIIVVLYMLGVINL